MTEHDLISIWCRLSNWSQQTFGIDLERGPIGPLKHLAKEAEEAMAEPRDISEYADCLLLIFDAVRRAGFSMDDLIMASKTKLTRNEKREYPKPAPDEISQHENSEQVCLTCTGTGLICAVCGESPGACRCPVEEKLLSPCPECTPHD